ncbi:acyltransferase family protein [Terriglobus roseus]|uniref:Peptidoglycan/LPS O-acetylase OafA/YrhL, contains acyltransferase and SGNH-hydrolase domains n=1 Tax=Terriglobus roseus TaxID=392734 RepID=A0A1G7MEL4_9BACT|nr:acyltransferase [Terriglobus roseus]SDF59569.1 Peptidoglycan/LPS O-acetylase OafA/YrhL, contains acyltransferase and SGNH-hydrolase domains [Terriglobus roseus]
MSDNRKMDVVQQENQSHAEEAPVIKHVLALDGLRGTAILLVLICHEWGDVFTVHGGVFLRTLNHLTAAGWVGVDLFFALSGFLLTGILFETQNEPSALRNFYARRALRTFPLYYGVLIVLVVGTMVAGYHWSPRLILWFTYLDNFDAVNWGGSPVTNASWVYIRHFWSLAVEEQFYLFWPVLLFAMKTQRRIVQAALGLAAFCLLFRIGMGLSGLTEAHPTILYCWTPARLDGMLFGAALAIGIRSNWRGRLLWICTWLARVGIPLAIVYVAMHGLYMFWSPISSTLGFTLIAIMLTALIGVSLQPGPAKRIFEHPVLRFFGKYSYGMYVLEPFVGEGIDRWVLPSVRLLIKSHTVVAYLRGAFVAVPLVAIAWLSYEMYERHFLRLKRYFVSPTAEKRISTAERAVAVSTPR